MRLSTSFITTEAPRRTQSCTLAATGWSTCAPSRETAFTLYCAGGTGTLSSTSLKLASVQICVMSSRRLMPAQSSTAANLPAVPSMCSGARS